MTDENKTKQNCYVAGTNFNSKEGLRSLIVRQTERLIKVR